MGAALDSVAERGGKEGGGGHVGEDEKKTVAPGIRGDRSAPGSFRLGDEPRHAGKKGASVFGDLLFAQFAVAFAVRKEEGPNGPSTISHGERLGRYGELIRDITDRVVDSWPTGTPSHSTFITVTWSSLF